MQQSVVKKQSSKIIWLSLLLISILFSNYSFACTPHPGDPWFLLDITVDEGSLPKDVQSIKNPTGYEIGFFNPGSIPFYIVSKVWDDPNKEKPDFKEADTGLPNGVIPKSKVVQGEHYWWNHFDFSPGKWEKENLGYDTDAIARLRLTDIGVKTMYKYGDNRPKNIAVPEVQEFKFMAYHGSKPVEITGQIKYSLNNNYDPKRSQKGVEVCSGMISAKSYDFVEQGIRWFVPLVVISGLVLIFILRKKTQKDKSN